ncbi:protein of unknown function [Acetoanaerobium sticklandii]|uniref:Uncharacterized protein n=1 Tax=Acetoanaerobium sticklandii (strain ATCC 12662 / DSM 519 / JCM 1433 / CCUG 9281 / NCIMB 10654 / HF) TaxID=499177 RepID=E3PT59_ACESD|nr:hypothetical protein [Acetoanaerobium sticklandii]CBH22063.1 protein of unknown function [Acetoanaerobium sticklandii]
MFKNVLKAGFSDITLEETFMVYLLAKAQADEEVCELALIMNQLLKKETVSDELYGKVSEKAKKLIEEVLKNKQKLLEINTTEYFNWIRNFRNDSIKYVICAKALANLELYPDNMQKNDLFNLVAALNMDRRHIIYDHLCCAVEKEYKDVPLCYFLQDKNIDEISEAFDIDKAMNKQKDINKVHCGIIRVLENLESDYQELFSFGMKALFEEFHNTKVSIDYDRDSVKVILTMFYLLEEYFMFKWEYIREQGLEGFVEKYICFDS